MLKAVAIDDEPMALEVIRRFAAQISFIELQSCFTNPLDAMTFLKGRQIDLLFLDIKMPDVSGIDFLKALTSRPMVIFTTAYSDHAVQSFELDAIDYLLKPFSITRFLKACNKASDQFRLRTETGMTLPEPTFIFVKSGYEKLRVELEDILYIESSGNYVRFVLKNKTIISRLTMGEVTDLLPPNAFIRVHRSYIAAKNKILKMDRNSIWVNQTELPAGTAYMSDIEKLR